MGDPRRNTPEANIFNVVWLAIRKWLQKMKEHPPKWWWLSDGAGRTDFHWWDCKSLSYTKCWWNKIKITTLWRVFFHFWEALLHQKSFDVPFLLLRFLGSLASALCLLCLSGTCQCSMHHCHLLISARNPWLDCVSCRPCAQKHPWVTQAKWLVRGQKLHRKHLREIANHIVCFMQLSVKRKLSCRGFLQIILS